MSKSKVMKYIEAMYDKKELAYLPSYEKAKTILSIYRNVVWQTTNKANNLVSECVASYGKELNTALVYLSEFASEYDKKDFEERVSSLFESKWLIGVIDKSLLKIREFPMYGCEYYTILYNYYLKEVKSTDYECMRLTKLEKTSYYQKKKEAISLLVIALFGFSLPNLLKELRDGKNDDEIFTDNKIKLAKEKNSSKEKENRSLRAYYP